MIDAILDRLKKLKADRERVIVAIDGRCAAGKTTLASALQKELECAVFHMDDFFLRQEQRTPERYAQPGGNVDRERFFAEVLSQISAGETAVYRPFDCHTMSLGKEITVPPGRVYIVEGTYSCHPELWDSYGLRIFVTVGRDEQLKRIKKRNGANAEAFEKRWIPLEERYFSAYDIMHRCDIVVNNDSLSITGDTIFRKSRT